MAILGNKRRVYLVASQSYTWLAGEQNNGVDLSNNLIDVSDKSTEWAQFIGGMKGATINVTVFTDDSSTAAQHAFLQALCNGTSVDVFVGELSGSNQPANGMLASCLVSGISDANNIGEVSSRTMNLTVNGEPTFHPAIS